MSELYPSGFIETYEWVFLPLIGLLTGSFLGVVVMRGPYIWGLSEAAENSEHHLSLAWPPSHCPACNTRLKTSDLIPLLSYIFLRRKCRYCSSPISVLYPLLEGLGLLAGLIAALIFSGWTAIAVFAAFMLLIAGSAIDQRTGFLPDALTLPLATLGFVCSTQALFVSMEMSIWGWVAGWGSFALIAALYQMIRGREGLGGGDAKLLGAVGTFTGPTGLPLVVMIGAAGALIWALSTGKAADSQAEIRFGPWLSVAAVLVIIAGAVWPALRGG